jgi:hypothetical protein
VRDANNESLDGERAMHRPAPPADVPPMQVRSFARFALVAG